MEFRDNFAVDTDNRFEIFMAGETNPNLNTREMVQNNTCSSREEFISSSIDKKLVHMFDELKFIRNEQVHCSMGMDKFHKSLTQMDQKVGQIANVTNSQTELMRALAYKSIDLEARSRRNNLIFRGLVEDKNENCYTVICDFLDSKLGIDGSNIYIMRAHRLGARVPGKNFHKRPIIVNFRDYGDIDYILSKANLLKKHPGFSIDSDYPKEIQAARSRLWPMFKDYRSTHPRSKVAIVYPAKIISDGRVVHDEFPQWNYYVNYDRLSNIEVIGARGPHGENVAMNNRLMPQNRASSTVQPQSFSAGYAPAVSNAHISFTNLLSAHDGINNTTEVQRNDPILQNTNNTGSFSSSNVSNGQPVICNVNREVTHEQMQSTQTSRKHFGEIPTLVSEACSTLEGGTYPITSVCGENQHVLQTSNSAASTYTHCPVTSIINPMNPVNQMNSVPQIVKSVPIDSECSNVAHNPEAPSKHNSVNTPVCNDQNNDQTFVKVLDTIDSQAPVSHVSRARNRSIRRTNSASPYRRNASFNNRISPVAKNSKQVRNHSRDRRNTQVRGSEVNR